MDYYQEIVAEYLDADRSVFLNMECFIQLEPGLRPPKDTTWYCDILAINLRESKAYLCEISYSKGLSAELIASGRGIITGRKSARRYVEIAQFLPIGR